MGHRVSDTRRLLARSKQSTWLLASVEALAVKRDQKQVEARLQALHGVFNASEEAVPTVSVKP